MDRWQQLLSGFENVSVSGTVLATDNLSGGGTGPRTLIAGKTGYQIYVLSIELSVTTDNAATQSIQDTASTPNVLFATKASPGVGPLAPAWFEPDGFACAVDKALTLSSSAAGLAYTYNITAYRRRTATAIV